MYNKYFKHKGFTLPEIMVYIALVAILFTGISSLLISAMRYHRTAEKIADLQHNALIALSNLSADMSESSPDAIKIDALDSTWVIFASPKHITTGNHSFDAKGDMKWQKWVGYYLVPQADGTKNLVKKEFPIDPATTAPGNPPYTTESALRTANGATRIIARGVESFTVNKGTHNNCYAVSIIIDRTTDTTKPNKINARTEISLMN